MHLFKIFLATFFHAASFMSSRFSYPILSYPILSTTTTLSYRLYNAVSYTLHNVLYYITLCEKVYKKPYYTTLVIVQKISHHALFASSYLFALILPNQISRCNFISSRTISSSDHYFQVHPVWQMGKAHCSSPDRGWMMGSPML
jgi:hypothetical protein